MNLEWSAKKIRLGDIHGYENNPRMITEEKFDDLKSSIKRLGLFRPMVMRFDEKTILGGNQRQRALLEEFPVNYEVICMIPNRELTSEEEEEVLLRDNLHSGIWDFDILANQFDYGVLEKVGFNPKDLNQEWDSDIGEIDKVKETLDGIEGKIKITCKQEDKDEVLIYLKSKLMETSFEGVHIE